MQFIEAGFAVERRSVGEFFNEDSEEDYYGTVWQIVTAEEINNDHMLLIQKEQEVCASTIWTDVLHY
jgi:hypothetical protein